LTKNLRFYSLLFFLLEPVWLKCYLLNFHSKVIVTSLYEEVTIHSPVWSIGVSYNPVFCVCLVINSPTNNNDWMVHVHPWNALIIERYVTQSLFFIWFFHFWFIFLWFFMVMTSFWIFIFILVSSGIIWIFVVWWWAYLGIEEVKL